MNTRWTLEEEKKLIREVKNGSALSGLSKELNRSENALELRIKKIIYDSIAGNKSINSISRSLNLPEEKVKQYFYSYKDMMEKTGKKTIDIDKKNDIDKNKETDILSNINLQMHINENNKEKKNNKGDKDEKEHKGGSRKEHKRNSKKDHHKDRHKDHRQIDLDKLKRQNDKMETILKNIQLKNEIKKALKTNKLDKREIKIVKDVIN
jgi:hypothetical protein